MNGFSFTGTWFLDWSANTYTVYRSTTDDVATALPATSASISSAYDGIPPRGVPLYYWVRATNSITTGEWSESFQGFRRIDNFSEFTADHGLTGADAKATADPDDDEFTNFEEWAQGGSDPTDSSSRPPLIPMLQNISGQDYLTVAYLRFFGGTENGDTYEHDWAHYSSSGTTDLEDEDWEQSPLPAPVPPGMDPAPSGYQWGCARLPVSTEISSHGFMKLDVIEPVP